MLKEGKLPVSRRAVLQRINNRLAKDGEIVKKARARVETTVGEYFRLDVQRNYIVETHVDIEELGKELGALHPFEALTEE
jgi:hypothetical protein